MVARGSVGGDRGGRVVGNEVRDEEGGLSKGMVIFCKPDLVVPILSQGIEAAKESFFLHIRNNLAQKLNLSHL